MNSNTPSRNIPENSIHPETGGTPSFNSAPQAKEAIHLLEVDNPQTGQIPVMFPVTGTSPDSPPLEEFIPATPPLSRECDWLVVPAGGVPSPQEGSMLKHIEKMVGQQIPSLTPVKAHGKWCTQNAKSRVLSEALANRLKRVSRGEFDYFRGREAVYDLVNEALAEGMAKPPAEFKRHGVRIRRRLGKNSFFPIIWEEKVFKNRRRLECFLATDPRGKRAEFLTVGKTRTTNHKEMVSRLKKAIPLIKEVLARHKWEIVAWRLDHGRLKPGRVNIMDTSANWHLHLVALPVTDETPADSNSQWQKDLATRLRVGGSRIRARVSTKMTGDARRLAGYLFRPVGLPMFAQINCDGALLKFFLDIRRIRRHGSCGSFYSASQRRYVAGDGELLGFDRVKRIHRPREDDGKWRYTMELITSRDIESGKKPTISGGVRTSVIAWHDVNYSLIGIYRL